MKSEGVSEGGGLFTASYCNICNAQLVSKSQCIAHYESKKHANKVRLFYMLHPEDGGPPSKRLRPDNPDSADTVVDRNKCCALCNMFFTSATVAQSHYQGKSHTKMVQLVLGPLVDTSPRDSSPCQPTPPPVMSPPLVPSASWPLINGNAVCKSCSLCGVSFNNPATAQQHYDGKKHHRNMARARLLDQLADSLDSCQVEFGRGLRGRYTCRVCTMTLNSIKQYHTHLQGSKHQKNLKKHQRCLGTAAL